MTRTPHDLAQHEPFLSAALLAAHATGAEGFRQRDVRFFMELFANWMAPSPFESPMIVHNTQILRQLQALSALRWARRAGRAPPRWRLSAEGLLGLLRRVSSGLDPRQPGDFLFVFHFLDAYGAKLRVLLGPARAAGSQLEAELATLTSPRRLLEEQRARVQRESSRLRARIDDARSTSQLARSLLDRGTPLAEVIAEVEARFPYELNHQRPLRELLDAMPEPWRREELTDTAERRANTLWEAQQTLLLAYEKLLSSVGEAAVPRTRRSRRS